MSGILRPNFYCFLIQHIREPTQCDNVLDLVFTSIECMTDNVKVGEPFSSSDHNVITFYLLYDSHISTWKEYYFDYGRGNYKEMDKCLQSVDWDALFVDSNLNEKCAIFKKCQMMHYPILFQGGKGELYKDKYGGQEK